MTGLRSSSGRWGIYGCGLARLGAGVGRDLESDPHHPEMDSNPSSSTSTHLLPKVQLIYFTTSPLHYSLLIYFTSTTPYLLHVYFPFTWRSFCCNSPRLLSTLFILFCSRCRSLLPLLFFSSTLVVFYCCSLLLLFPSRSALVLNIYFSSFLFVKSFFFIFCFTLLFYSSCFSLARTSFYFR